MLTGKKRDRDLTPSHEHYLRAIWEVRSRLGFARLVDVARELGVAPPTLSVGLRPLEKRRLVAHDPQRFLVLTAQGERVARHIHHRFAVAHTFLKEVLGVSEKHARAEACLLEHDLSAGTTDRLLDLVKLLHDDAELCRFFRKRFSDYHRACRPPAECATCDLACLTSVAGPRS